MEKKDRPYYEHYKFFSIYIYFLIHGNDEEADSKISTEIIQSTSIEKRGETEPISL